MAKQIDDFCLNVIGNIQKEILDATEFLNDDDIRDIYTFLAHWLLTEIIYIEVEKEIK